MREINELEDAGEVGGCRQHDQKVRPCDVTVDDPVLMQIIKREQKLEDDRLGDHRSDWSRPLRRIIGDQLAHVKCTIFVCENKNVHVRIEHDAPRRQMDNVWVIDLAQDHQLVEDRRRN